MKQSILQTKNQERNQTLQNIFNNYSQYFLLIESLVNDKCSFQLKWTKSLNQLKRNKKNLFEQEKRNELKQKINSLHQQRLAQRFKNFEIQKDSFQYQQFQQSNCLIINKILNENFKPGDRQIFSNIDRNQDNFRSIQFNCLTFQALKKISINGLEFLKQYQTGVGYDSYHKGIGLLNQGKLIESIEQFEEAIQSDPNNPYFYEKKGFALIEMFDLEGALKQLNIAINLNPNQPSFYCNKATVLLMKNNLEDAIKYYDISLEKGKPNSSCIRNKGLALFLSNRFEEAKELFDLSIKLGEQEYKELENYGKFQFNQLAQFLHSQEFFGLAQYIRQFAEKLFRSNLNISYSLQGITLLKIGKCQEALENYEIALQISSNNPWSHIYKAILLAQFGQYQQALESLDTSLEVNPNISEIYILKSMVLYFLGQTEEALKNIDIAISMNPERFDYFTAKARLLFFMQRFQEALEYSNYLNQINPKYSLNYQVKAQALVMMNRYQEALEALKWRFNQIKRIFQFIMILL